MEENKTLEIVAPEGYEIDKENSTFEKIVFKHKKSDQLSARESKKNDQLSTKESKNQYYKKDLWDFLFPGIGIGVSYP